jgi:hypothetical protein
MNQRERLVNTLRFRTVDRIPFIEGGIRKATMDAWISQGYPKGVPSEQFFGFDTSVGASFKTRLRMNPSFEETIIDQNEKYKMDNDG